MIKDATEMSDSASVGLLGLGALGEIFAGHLSRAFPGFRVFDLDGDKVARAVTDHGAVAAASARELGAGCDAVVVSLPNPAAVQAALSGPDGLLEGAHSGAVVLDTSTISPQASRAMHAAAAERGVAYLDAPVSGGEPFQTGVDGARAATMTFMVGGDAEAFERARPLMDVLGEFAFLLGPSGAGSTVKLISNLCSGIHALVAAEAFTLGAACGFAPERLLEVFAHTDAKSFFMTDYVAPRIASGDVSPGFTVELQLKDHRLAAELGHEQRVPLPFNALAIDAWQRMRAQGRGANDVTDAVFFSAEQARRELGAPPAPTGRAPGAGGASPRR
jgi:3-hydroxyisobutyrate dehydrogenase-like beta-hydroxyacid dehydrogenase